MTRIERPFDITRLEDEWLDADGFGGFASGTVGTLRTRRYHALLLTATTPPTGRMHPFMPLPIGIRSGTTPS